MRLQCKILRLLGLNALILYSFLEAKILIMSNSKYPKIGIYIITCTYNDKHYIGRSKDMKRRLAKHKAELKHNVHKNEHLQRAFNKYGDDYFIFDTLEEYSIDILCSMEHYWCNVLDSHNREFGYNTLPTGPVGHTSHSEETKNKIGNMNRGRMPPNKGLHVSEESRKRMSECKLGNTYNKGIPMSEEGKQKLRIIHTGKMYHSPVKHSDETKKLLSEMKKGKKFTEEHKINLRKAKLKKINYDTTNELRLEKF